MLKVNNHKVWRLLLDEAICPDCLSETLYKGPEGGICTNVYCATCGAAWNHVPGIFAESIGTAPKQFLDYHKIKLQGGADDKSGNH